MKSQAEARAVTILAVRLGGIFLITVVMWVGLSAGWGITGFPPNSLWATLGLLPVNIVCLLLVRRWHRTEGRTLQEALGIRRGRIGRDVLWGLLWLAVLNIPFALAIAGTVFALYGAQAPQAFETIFVNPEAETLLGPGVLLLLAVIAVIPFMIINAPTEELVYRGHGLAGLREGSVAWGRSPSLRCCSVCSTQCSRRRCPACSSSSWPSRCGARWPRSS